jgi:hypothetical protein
MVKQQPAVRLPKWGESFNHVIVSGGAIQGSRNFGYYARFRGFTLVWNIYGELEAWQSG